MARNDESLAEKLASSELVVQTLSKENWQLKLRLFQANNQLIAFKLKTLRTTAPRAPPPAAEVSGLSAVDEDTAAVAAVVAAAAVSQPVQSRERSARARASPDV